MKRLLAAAGPQLMLCCALLALELLHRHSSLPGTREIVNQLGDLLEQGGYPAIGLVSFLESTIGLNLYFPGAVVILAAMALAAGNPSRGLMTFLAIMLPSMLAHTVNYGVGRWISMRRKRQTPEDRRQQSSALGFAFMISFAHPHLASITSYAAGAEEIRPLDFFRFMIVSSLAWNIFWGLLVYHFAVVAGESSGLIWVFYGYVLLWTLKGIREGMVEKQRTPS